MILENTVEIAGQTVKKERFGMAAHDDIYKTFTGNVLLEKDAPKFHTSVEENFKGATLLDGIVVWKSNGAIPFADMILDFVQIDAIDMETAERTIAARAKDDSDFWKEYGLPVKGDTSGTRTKKDAVQRSFDKRDARKARIDLNDWFEDGSCTG